MSNSTKKEQLLYLYNQQRDIIQQGEQMIEVLKERKEKLRKDIHIQQQYQTIIQMKDDINSIYQSELLSLHDSNPSNK